jgi:biotin operon repressor
VSYAFWYFLGPGVIWRVLNHPDRGEAPASRVFPGSISRAQVHAEFRYSCRTILIMGIGWMLVWTLDRLRWGQFYWDIEEHSISWLVFSIVLTAILWDAWFYWTHRFMHHRRRYAAIEAQKIGFGGVPYISQVLGISRQTIYTGMQELQEMGKRIANNRRVLAGIRIESAGVGAGAVRMLNAKRGWRRPQSTFWKRAALVVPPTRTYGGRTSSRCGWLRS